VDAVTFTLPVKQKLAGQLRLRVEDTTIRIPDQESIRNDWHAVEKLVTTGGNVLYRAERTRDGHADRFWGAALCVDAAKTNETPWQGESVSVPRRSSWRMPSTGWDPDDRGARRRRRQMAGV